MEFSRVKMADVSTTKSIFALTVVVGCFAVLWPKIFFPMMQAGFRMATHDSIESNGENEIMCCCSTHVHLLL